MTDPDSTFDPVEYVLPLRWDDDRNDIDGLARYLRGLVDHGVDVTVVDGSDRSRFHLHATYWPEQVRHLRPGPWPGINRKVAGVVTGVHRARHERVVIADDDVRYTPHQVYALAARLDEADLVAPQNFLGSRRWHAQWDTARSLLNRAFGHDHPGTFALRQSTFRRMGGYNGDALFENLQLIRTVQAAHGTVRHLPGFYVRREPPTVRQFWNQRIRQAYDDFAQPARLIREMLWLPSVVVAAARRPLLLPAAAVLGIAAAERGRRKEDGWVVFPRTASLWAPLWILERSLGVWAAVVLRASGGVPYRGKRVRLACLPVDASQPLPDVETPDRARTS